MKWRRLIVGALTLPLLCLNLGAHAQRRQRRPPAAPARRAERTTAAADARMTGVYLFNPDASGDHVVIAERATAHLPPEERQRAVEELIARLDPPGQIAIRRRGRNVEIASTRAPRIFFEADGLTHTEQTDDGRTARTRAVIYGDTLMVTSRRGPDDEFYVSFDSIEGGRRLRVTRRIYEPRLRRTLVVQSVYDKTSSAARFSVYGEPVPARVATARNTPPRQSPTGRVPPRPQPPVIRRSEPPPTAPARAPRPAPVETDPFGGFYIGDDAQFVAVLNDDLSTESAREGDPFTLTVRAPGGFEGAVIEGRVASVDRGGRASGRAELTLDFERIRLADGRAADFAAFIEEVRPPSGGEDVRVDNESRGNVQERDSPTNRTAQRVAIGAAVGAIIGALSGGGKGAAIGAAVGAGAGAGSVYVQGRDHLELRRGTEMILRARPPR